MRTAVAGPALELDNRENRIQPHRDEEQSAQTHASVHPLQNQTRSEMSCKHALLSCICPWYFPGFSWHNMNGKALSSREVQGIIAVGAGAFP